MCVCILMDLRLQNNTVFQIVGPSGCGKTMFVTQLLTTDGIFQQPIKHIYWLMGVDDGESGDTAKQLKHLKAVTFLKGFEKGWMDKPKQGDVLVIDDLFMEANKEKGFNNLFTKVARHRGITVIFITQNMFQQGGGGSTSHRTRNLNVHYLVLFRNPRDSTVIQHVARQAFPTDKHFLIDAYHDATKDTPHGYIFIDFTQTCIDQLRIRTNIFQPPIIIYKQQQQQQE